MKTSSDPRHLKRIKMVQNLYSFSFNNKANELISPITKNIKSIDSKIVKNAPAWPIEKLNKIDLAVLRLAIYELSHTDTPPKVVIDEAVELAKHFGSENSPSFVNGVLANIHNKA